MRNNPFSLLEPFQDILRVSIFTKEDNADEEVIKERMDIQCLALPQQVHGTETAITRGEGITPDVDGLLTDEPKLALTAMWADCQNFLLFEPKQKILGVLHVGWRGLVAGAIPRFMDALTIEWHTNPSDCFVVSGPSLCQKCAHFDDVTGPIKDIGEAYIHGNEVDLCKAADDAFFASGIAPDQFQRLDGCTSCDHDQYWTYRGGDREAVKQGGKNWLCGIMV